MLGQFLKPSPPRPHHHCSILRVTSRQTLQRPVGWGGANIWHLHPSPTVSSCNPGRSVCASGRSSSPPVQGCHGNIEVGLPSAVCGDLSRASAMLEISVGRQLTYSGTVIGHIWCFSALECLDIKKPGVPQAACRRGVDIEKACRPPPPAPG